MSENKKKESGGFGKIVEPIIRKVLENIESPFVWMPLGLFILCVLAYQYTSAEVFLYLSVAFVILTFGADWVGRWQNRKTPPKPVPQESNYRDDLFKHLNTIQRKALSMIQSGKTDAAQALTKKNLQAIDEALKEYPSDADFHALMGYTLKDIYQSSKQTLPTNQRQAYLGRARAASEQALRLDPKNASAHLGMGNILFFEGRFDDALKEIDLALDLTDGKYKAAEDDKELVLRVKNGEVPFDF